MAKKNQPTQPLDDEGGLLMQQVDEQLRNDQIVQFFTKHQKAIFAAILAFVLLVGGYYTYSNWQANEAAKRSEQAAQARVLMEQENFDRARVIYTQLSQNSSDFFALEAAIALARISQQEGNIEAAISSLEAVAANNKFDPAMRNLARFALFELSIAQGDTALSQAQIEALETSAYGDQVAELKLALALETQEGEQLQATFDALIATIADSDSTASQRMRAIARASGLKVE